MYLSKSLSLPFIKDIQEITKSPIVKRKTLIMGNTNNTTDNEPRKNALPNIIQF